VHADHLGSTRLVTTPTGAVGTRLGYTAFGETVTHSNPGGPAARSRYGYCGGWGYETDGLGDAADPLAAAGLMHVGARYYAPAIGRFVQRDPTGIGGGINVYAYCRTSPLSFIDPAGHDYSATQLVAAQAVIGVMFKTMGITIRASIDKVDTLGEEIAYGAGVLFDVMGDVTLLGLTGLGRYGEAMCEVGIQLGERKIFGL
jgi:RHS repeat-associated protein